MCFCLFVVFLLFCKRKDRQTIPWSKEKKRQTNNTMVKRIEKTDKEYHGQKKRKEKT
jgi:hypothetical protein